MNGISRRKNNLLSVPDKMLTELALGTDEPSSIASRYGYDVVDFETLENQPHFKRAMAARVAELESKGEIFKVKARYLADDLLEDVYKDAKATVDPKVRLEAIKFLSAAGGVATPPQKAGAGDGRQVSININLGAAGTARATIDFDDLFGEDGPRPNSDLIGDYTEVDDE